MTVCPMPELPEVETIRRDLIKKILNKKITVVKVLKARSVGGSAAPFIKILTGNSFSRVDRRGKLLILRFASAALIGSGKTAPTALLCHLKMTGQLIYEKETKTKIEIVAGGHKLSEKDIDALPNQWTRIAFVFADGSELFFNDLRLFGYMKLASTEEVEKALKKYGPEPIEIPLPAGEGQRVRAHSPEFIFDYFSSLFSKRKNTTLKALLLNQELIAGLGNIYVDEVCFCAGVRPMRRVGSVSKAEQKKIFVCIPKVLTKALKHRGTTFRNFLDSSGKKGNYTDFLRVYDRDGEPCKHCGTIIRKTVAAGRGTHFCPSCQR